MKSGDLDVKRNHNLAKLAIYLINKKDHPNVRFSMDGYCYPYNYNKDISCENLFNNYEPSEVLKKSNECKTVNCFLGHGPLAGLKANKGESWECYYERIFLED